MLALAASASGQAPSNATAAEGSPASLRLLEPKQAHALGLETAWQSRLPLRPGGRLQGLRVRALQGSDPGAFGVFGWDDDGVILSMDPASGEMRWRSSSATPGAGQTLVDVAAAETNTTKITVGLGDSSCMMLDARTGGELGRSRYQHLPATPANPSSIDLVFGGRGGHLVWLGFRDEQIAAPELRRGGDRTGHRTAVVSVRCVAYEELSHRLDGAFSATPAVRGDVVIACTTTGQVACFRTSRRSCAWSIDLPGGVVATPALDEAHCYVASRDQHLRCIEIESGKTLWKWFCESPLEHAPLVAGNLVMLQVPDVGLVALETAEAGGRTREPKWKCPVRGNPLTRCAEGVLVWDAGSHTLSLVDPVTGVLRNASMLASVDSVQASAPVDGDLYLMARDGRVQRCKPTGLSAVAKAPEVEPTAMPASGDTESVSPDPESSAPPESESAPPPDPSSEPATP